MSRAQRLASHEAIWEQLFYTWYSAKPPPKVRCFSKTVPHKLGLGGFQISALLQEPTALPYRNLCKSMHLTRKSRIDVARSDQQVRDIRCHVITRRHDSGSDFDVPRCLPTGSTLAGIHANRSETTRDVRVSHGHQQRGACY